MDHGENTGHYGYRDGSNRRLLVLCDHATNRIPTELGNLGLPPEELNRHIAYDIGALPLAKAIAARLSAPMFWHAWSRLVVDPNRYPTCREVVIPQSDLTVVPANQGLCEARRSERIARYHTPYHAAIREHLDVAAAAGERPVLLAIHSMTPMKREDRRPREMQTAVLRLEDESGQRLAGPLIDWLRGQTLTVGDNDPYSAIELNSMGYTLDHHGRARGLPYLLVEVRQDLLEQPEAIEAWADQLVAGFRAVCGVGR